MSLKPLPMSADATAAEHAKRGFDLIVAALGLVLTSPVLIVTALLVRLTSKGPVFFRQERIGRGFRPFSIYKFRTMRAGADLGPSVTSHNDPRITPLGRRLRRFKIDELPQLLNVLKGEMSMVGPRPEVRRYVELFRNDYEEILSVRPGITDDASIEFRHEERILGAATDPQALYVRDVLPQKIELAKRYVRTMGLGRDVVILLRTLLHL